jgi:hypothetical protein
MAESTHTSLAAALAAFQGEVPTFKKSKTAKVKMKTGGEYTYTYADLGDILPVVGPLMAKHGLSWSSKPGRDEQGEWVLRYVLRHDSGESDNDEMSLCVEKRCKPQELGSAITYMRRYAQGAQLGLATEGDDDGNTAQGADRSASRANGNGATERTATPDEVREITAAAKGLTTQKVKLVLASCGVPAVEFFDDVPAAKVLPLVKALAAVEREA